MAHRKDARGGRPGPKHRGSQKEPERQSEGSDRVKGTRPGGRAAHEVGVDDEGLGTRGGPRRRTAVESAEEARKRWPPGKGEAEENRGEFVWGEEETDESVRESGPTRRVDEEE